MDVTPAPQQPVGDAATYPRFWEAVGLVLLAIVVQYFVGTNVDLIGRVVRVLRDDAPLNLAVTNALSLGLIIAWGHYKTGARFAEVFPLGPVPRRLWPGIALLLLGSATFGRALYALLNCISPEPEWLDDSLDMRLDPAGAYVLAVLVAPVTEELLFRGLILRGFVRNYGATVAIAASALMFALLHVSPWRLVSVAVDGAFMAWLVIRTRSLIPALLMHAVGNGLAVLLMLSASQPDAAWELSPDVQLLLLLAGVLLTLKAVGVLRDRLGKVGLPCPPKHGSGNMV